MSNLETNPQVTDILSYISDHKKVLYTREALERRCDELKKTFPAFGNGPIPEDSEGRDLHYQHPHENIAWLDYVLQAEPGTAYLSPRPNLLDQDSDSPKMVYRLWHITSQSNLAYTDLDLSEILEEITSYDFDPPIKKIVPMADIRNVSQRVLVELETPGNNKDVYFNLQHKIHKETPLKVEMTRNGLSLTGAGGPYSKTEFAHGIDLIDYFDREDEKREAEVNAITSRFKNFVAAGL